MRYYSIQIDGQEIWTSYVNGQTIAGAPLVEFDIPVTTAGTPDGDTGAMVKVWGVSLADINQAKNLALKSIKVYGGFQKGLPLANPQQNGLLVEGYIWQCYGTWVGTEQSITFIIKTGEAPKPSTFYKPLNLVLNANKGDTMATAIKNALATAFPNLTAQINISPKLVFQAQEQHYANTISDFASYVRNRSIALMNDTSYQGVSILPQASNFIVFDGPVAGSSNSSLSSSGSPLATNDASGNTSAFAINFSEFIGQPTWIDVGTIQFKCPMRADIKVGNNVKMPKALVINTGQAQTALVNQVATFQGTFQVQVVRHVGNSRAPSADAWVTIFNAFTKPVGA